jgi:hypothetical protein
VRRPPKTAATSSGCREANTKGFVEIVARRAARREDRRPMAATNKCLAQSKQHRREQREPCASTERAAAIMLAAILPANAQRVIGRFDVPPAEYDHPYSGKLVVVKVSKRDLLQF